MPINILRLNHAPSSHPNSRISFIKPLPRSTDRQSEYDHASTFLYAIAAQCLPIMKSQYLSVTTLEEHEPNKEFIGRNFNNGEIIQLVLRRRDNSWMSFNQVQMVMMHELAHNVQMNHSKAFWTERNKLAGQLKDLWARGYTGDGFWGSGRSLQSLKDHIDNVITVGVGEEVQALCGGTFCRQSKKRKRGRKSDDNISEHPPWKRARDRRIEKKFGRNGVAVGEDEEARIRLEISRKGPVGPKPRVAGSKRGRELRAAAALDRFGSPKEVRPHSEPNGCDNHECTDQEMTPVVEFETEEPSRVSELDKNQARNKEIVTMIRVCNQEDINQADARGEMNDICQFQCQVPKKPGPVTQVEQTNVAEDKGPRTTHEPTPKPQNSKLGPSFLVPKKPPTVTCPICTSSENKSISATCSACSHVLDRRKDPRAWKCTGNACERSSYLNAGDCGRCGCCGERKE